MHFTSLPQTSCVEAAGGCILSVTPIRRTHRVQRAHRLSRSSARLFIARADDETGLVNCNLLRLTKPCSSGDPISPNTASHVRFDSAHGTVALTSIARGRSPYRSQSLGSTTAHAVNHALPAVLLWRSMCWMWCCFSIYEMR